MPKAPKKTTEPAGHRPLRADAQRNQQQILTAARDVFVERGTDAPLDEIARRAGVGIGTLYRRFTDRPTLLRAVVVDALTHTRQAAERARTEASDAFAALTAYMHAVLDLRVSAVIPLALDRLDLDDEQLLPLREASAQAAERMVEDAHADGSLPEDVTFGDIGMMLVRLSQPLPGPMSADLDNRLAHRHLDLLIEGLRPRPRRRPPGGPRLARADLHEIGEEEHADVPRAGRAR